MDYDETITVEEFKKLLGDQASGLSDERIRHMRDTEMWLVDYIIEYWRRTKTTGKKPADEAEPENLTLW